MNLRRKIHLFLVLLVIVPVTIMTIGAHYTATQEQEKVLDSVLDTGIRVVRGEMLERKNGMRRVCNVIASSPGLQQAVLDKNGAYLQNSLLNVKRYFEYVDYMVIVNRQQEPLAAMASDMKYSGESKLGSLVAEAMDKQEVIFSEEDLSLENLFRENSLEYDRYVIKGDTPGFGVKELLNKALTSVAIVPIYQGDLGKQTVIGAIVVGDIYNNDLAFPSYVGTYAHDAVVLASMDGIRVAANFTQEGAAKFLGTPINATKPYKNFKSAAQFTSKLWIQGKEYKLLNREITDWQKKSIGMIGIGLPVREFYTMTAASNYFLLFALILSLSAFFWGRRYLDKLVVDPLFKLLEQQKVQGLEVMAGTEEISALGKWYYTLLTRVKLEEARSAKIQEDYLEEHEKQLFLTTELKGLKNNMEKQIAERTDHLAVINEELRQANAVKTRFLAGLSHELKTPLHIILSSTEVLRDEILGPVNTKQKNYLEGISSSGNYLLSLLNNLLTMSRVEFGKLELHPVDFALEEVVQEVVHNISRMDKDKKLNLTVKIDPPTLRLKADPHKIRQVIYNLVSNSVKFTPDGGSVSVHATKQDDCIRLVVADTGMGIKKDSLNRVFKPFEQAGGSPEHKYEGTGLGLAIVKSIVEKHGGTVWLESEEGKGCKVTVLLPLNKFREELEIEDINNGKDTYC